MYSLEYISGLWECRDELLIFFLASNNTEFLENSQDGNNVRIQTVTWVAFHMVKSGTLKLVTNFQNQNLFKKKIHKINKTLARLTKRKRGDDTK